jgi:hypothetical protein
MVQFLTFQIPSTPLLPQAIIMTPVMPEVMPEVTTLVSMEEDTEDSTAGMATLAAITDPQPLTVGARSRSIS